MRFSKLKLVVALPLFLGIVACDRNSVDQEQSEDQVDIGNSPELQAQDKITSKSMVEDKTIESSDDYFSNEEFLIDGISSKEYKDLNQYGTADEQGFRDFITKTIIAKTLKLILIKINLIYYHLSIFQKVMVLKDRI